MNAQFHFGTGPLELSPPAHSEGSNAGTLFTALVSDSKCDTAVFPTDRLLFAAVDSLAHLNWPTVCTLGVAQRQAVSPDKSNRRED